VTIFDSGTAGGAAFLVMELPPSPNLEAYLAERGPLPEQEVIALVREVASGLAAARRSFPNKMKEKSFRNWAALLNPTLTNSSTDLSRLLPVTGLFVPPGAGVKAGRRPPAGLGRHAGEDGATLRTPGAGQDHVGQATPSTTTSTIAWRKSRPTGSPVSSSRR